MQTRNEYCPMGDARFFVFRYNKEKDRDEKKGEGKS